MQRSLLFLLLIIVINKGLFAQQSTAGNDLSSEKKSPAPSSNNTTGFKKQSASSAEKNGPVKKQNQVSAGSRKNTAGSVDAENASKVSETIRVDYNNMPADVQLKISQNKVARKKLLEGITKVFTVEIKTCITDDDHKKALSFLKGKKGFINSQFVSAGLVRIIVEPTFDSVDLKDALLAEGIRFNFLNRSYLLKK